jgi:protein-L-isoaspartate(D-aspartate) O-methyltransferase
MQGWPLQAPFDRIIVTAGAFDEPPRQLLDQLAIQGRMIIPVGHPATGQFLCLFRRESDEVVSMQRLVETRFVPLLPNIAKDEEGRHEHAA